MPLFSRLALLIGFSALLPCHVFAFELESVWQMPNQFESPESAVYDQARQIIYVSNINGVPTEKDGNGYISTVTLEGELAESKWLDGFDAPKGMAIAGSKLYVSDISTLIEIDLDSRQITNRYIAPGAEYLNDVTTDRSGNVYVSDMVTNTIHRLSEGELTAWINDEQLENPNGLYIDGERMIVASWGKMNPDFSTDVPGRLLQIDIATTAVSNLGNGKPIGNLDGVQPDGKGNFYVTDGVAGKLFRITEKGHAKKILKMCRGVADLEFIAERQLLVIPIMHENALVAFQAID